MHGQTENNSSFVLQVTHLWKTMRLDFEEKELSVLQSLFDYLIYVQELKCECFEDVNKRIVWLILRNKWICVLAKHLNKGNSAE